MNVIVFGACGRMGSEVCRMANEGFASAVLSGAVDICGGEGVLHSLLEVKERADVLIDFSHHSAVGALLDYAVAHQMPTVIATTGHTESEQQQIRDAAAKIPVFWTANMSVGVAVLIKLATDAARMFPHADIEIVEAHHNRKLDAPSGTALMIADSLRELRENAVYTYGRAGQHRREPEEIGIHSLRMGNVIGMHEVIICTDTQTLRISHEAQSRSLFAEGALTAAEFLCRSKPGLYNMHHMIGD